jgi:hypothetical protein
MIQAAIILCIIVMVPALDWAGMARLAVLCDLYQYWPPTRLRVASVLVLEMAAISVVLVPGTARLWMLPLVLIAAVGWVAVGVRDILTQG